MAKQTELVLTDTETSILDAITLKKEELTEWVKTADAYVVTAQTLKEADTFRKKGKNFRLEIQRIAKGNNDKLNKLKSINSEREAEFVEATGLAAAEKRLDAKIKAIEDAIEAERLAKLKAEEDRKRAIKNRIMQIENMVSMVRASDDIDELNKMQSGVELETDTFSEFNEDGNAAVKQTLTAIQNRIGILKDEAELQQRKQAKIASRKEMLANYPATYWPTDEELGVFTQEEFEDAIVHIEEKIKADGEDNIVLVKEEIPDFKWKDETISDSPDRRTHPLRNDEAFKLNHFSVNGMWFGLDEKLPFAFASSIRQAIEKILSA